MQAFCAYVGRSGPFDKNRFSDSLANKGHPLKDLFFNLCKFWLGKQFFSYLPHELKELKVLLLKYIYLICGIKVTVKVAHLVEYYDIMLVSCSACY